MSDVATDHELLPTKQSEEDGKAGSEIVTCAQPWTGTLSIRTLAGDQGDEIMQQRQFSSL